jgi:ribosomal protein S27E
MATKSDFTATNVQWRYTPSRTIGSNAVVRSGIERMDVTCDECGHAWTSERYGSNRMNPVIGGYIVKCPGCGVERMIRSNDVQ